MAKIKTIKEKKYVLQAELEIAPKEQSTFKLKDLNPYQASEIYDILFENGKLSFSTRVFIKAAELGIVG